MVESLRDKKLPPLPIKKQNEFNIQVELANFREGLLNILKKLSECEESDLESIEKELAEDVLANLAALSTVLCGLKKDQEVSASTED